MWRTFRGFFGWQNFQCGHSFEARVLRLVHDTHATFAEFIMSDHHIPQIVAARQDASLSGLTALVVRMFHSGNHNNPLILHQHFSRSNRAHRR